MTTAPPSPAPPRLLVVTVVHHADDPRIRERTLRTLADRWTITYRTRTPAPNDATGLDWRPLAGGRIRRNMAALAALVGGSYDVAQVHDPELVPAAMIARIVRRKPIVFDVHENVPGQIATKDWVPARRLVARTAARILRLAEPLLDVTLAESGYQELFARSHPVFPNHPDTDEFPDPRGADDPREIVYIGSVTVERGIAFLVDVMPIDATFTIIGPCADDLARAIEERAAGRGVSVRLLGRLPHRDALDRAAGAALGVSPLFDTPNYRNSLPTKVLEYLALGLPVVASDLPGTREVVGDEPTVHLVPAADAAAWTTALEKGLDPLQRETAQRHADAVADRFRWPGDEVLSHYESLLSARDSR